MHVQHVIDDGSRCASRYIWASAKALIDWEHTCVVVKANGHDHLPQEIKKLTHYVVDQYYAIDNPDCVVLHSVANASIGRYKKPTLCIQHKPEAPPFRDVATVSISRAVDRIVECGNVINSPGIQNEEHKGDKFTIGILGMDSELLSGVATVLGDVEIRVPWLSELTPKSVNEAGDRLKVSVSQSLWASCQVMLCPDVEDDYSGDVVASALLVDCVPVVSVKGAKREFLQGDALVYRSKHEAIRIAYDLVYRVGYWQETLSKCKDYYHRRFAPDIFKQRLANQIEKVVA